MLYSLLGNPRGGVHGRAIFIIHIYVYVFQLYMREKDCAKDLREEERQVSWRITELCRPGQVRNEQRHSSVYIPGYCLSWNSNPLDPLLTIPSFQQRGLRERAAINLLA